MKSTAWHGSPRNFRRFSTSKIGSGQGENKHGWGIYLTEHKDRAAFYATLSAPSGFVYKVNIPEGIYLDWDALLSNQERTAAAITASLPAKDPFFDPPAPIEQRVQQFNSLVQCGWRGLDGYDHLVKYLGNKKKASKTLASHGVTGIKYIGKDEWDGTGTTGYVVFNPSSIKIISKSPTTSAPCSVTTAEHAIPSPGS